MSRTSAKDDVHLQPARLVELVCETALLECGRFPGYHATPSLDGVSHCAGCRYSIALVESLLKYRTLGRTVLEVSSVSLGTGGPSRIGQWTHRDEAESHRVIHRALDLGINLFDTAADYSDSEEILGRALKNTPRDKYLIATKFTPTRQDDGEEGQIVESIISPEELVESCERSLKRLQIDAIDVFQFHGVLPGNYRECVDRLLPTAKALQEQGKVRFLGITEYFYQDPAHEMLDLALADDLWDTIMVKYGILNISAAWSVLPKAAAQNVGVFNMSAVRAKMTRPNELEEIITRWKKAGLIEPGALPTRKPLDFLIHDGVESVVAGGYKFGIEPEAVSTLLVGTGNVQHLEENVDTLLGPPLPTADNDRIRDVFGSFAASEEDS